MHLVNLGISHAKQVLLIADGAEWIWKHIPPLLSRVGCPKETYQLLDFYHVTEHLQTFADAAFSQESERKAWFKKARNILRRNFAFNLIVEMNQLIFTATPERAKIMMAQRDYLERADVENRLIYAYISEQKLPIGSGAIEFWLKANAEIMLHLRCQWIAGSWDNFCNSIFTSFLNPQTSS